MQSQRKRAERPKNTTVPSELWNAHSHATISESKKLKHQPASETSLMRKLCAAMAYANNTCIFSTNRIEDIERTNGWSIALHFRFFSGGGYRKNNVKTPYIDQLDRIHNRVYDHNTKRFELQLKSWYYHIDNWRIKNIYSNATLVGLNPIALPFTLPSVVNRPDLLDVLVQSLMSITTRTGNCGERTRLVSKYLWENPEGIHSIHGIKMLTFDHAFVLVNCSGNIDDPDTWGDAWIIDPWVKDGLIIHASEFKQKIKEVKEYVEFQRNALKTLKIATKPIDQSTQEKWSSAWVIRPELDAYPTFDKKLKIEDYYQYDDRRFEKLPCSEEQARNEHKALFQDSLNQIKSLGMK